MNNATARMRREDAILDGRLVDVTGHARQLGILSEVALTSACWNRCVQDEEVKLTTILERLRLRFCPSGRIPQDSVETDGEPEFFAVVLHEGPARYPTLFRLGVVWSSGDSSRLAMTVFISEAWWQNQNVHQI